jgi:hypothetical protein
MLTTVRKPTDARQGLEFSSLVTYLKGGRLGRIRFEGLKNILVDADGSHHQKNSVVQTSHEVLRFHFKTDGVLPGMG